MDGQNGVAYAVNNDQRSVAYDLNGDQWRAAHMLNGSLGYQNAVAYDVNNSQNAHTAWAINANTAGMEGQNAVAHAINGSQHDLGWAVNGSQNSHTVWSTSSLTGTLGNQTVSMGQFSQGQVSELQKVEAAQGKTASLTDVVARATGGAETLLESVLRKLGNDDSGAGRIVDAVAKSNLEITNGITSVVAAIKQQSDAAARELKRQQDLAGAQVALENFAKTQAKTIGEVNAGIAGIWSLASAFGVGLGDGAGGSATFGVNAGGTFDATYNSISLDLQKFDSQNIPAFRNAFWADGGVYDQTYGRAGELSTIAQQLESARVAVRTLGGVPQFAKGSNYLPSDMLAQVHEGERIMPAADNRELMQRLQSPQQNNDELVAELRALRSEVQGLRAEARATAINSNRTAKDLREIKDRGLLVTTPKDTTLQVEVAA